MDFTQIVTLPNILALGFVLIVVVGIAGIALVEVSRKGKLKTPLGLIGGKDESPCASYVAEHAAILARLERNDEESLAILRTIADRVNSNDEATGALIASARITSKWIRRELGRERGEQDRINGDLDDVDEELDRAQAKFREGRRITA